LLAFFSDEIHDLTDQIGEGGRSIHETDKLRRRLELEKEELQAALEEAEGALEQEEAKVARAGQEVASIRGDIDRRLAEKDEEFESSRCVCLSSSYFVQNVNICILAVQLIMFYTNPSLHWFSCKYIFHPALLHRLRLARFHFPSVDA